MKACGIVVASLTSGSPCSRAGLVTNSGMSPQREPDQTQREASARSRARISQNPIRKPDNVKNWWGIEIKKKKKLDMDEFHPTF